MSKVPREATEAACDSLSWILTRAEIEHALEAALPILYRHWVNELLERNK
jgi:hypothetical protein